MFDLSCTRSTAHQEVSPSHWQRSLSKITFPLTPSPASPPGLAPAWLARGRLEAPSEFSFPPRSRPCRPSPPVPTGSLLRKWSPARTGHWCDGSETRHNYNNTQHSLQNGTFSLSQLPMAGLSPTPAQTIYGQNYFDRALTSQPCREETFVRSARGQSYCKTRNEVFFFWLPHLYIFIWAWNPGVFTSSLKTTINHLHLHRALSAVFWNVNWQKRTLLKLSPAVPNIPHLQLVTSNL